MIDIKNIPLLDRGKTLLGRTVFTWPTRPAVYFNVAIDRLNWYVVPAVLLFCIAVISANVFGFTGGEHIRCLRAGVSEMLAKKVFEALIEPPNRGHLFGWLFGRRLGFYVAALYTPIKRLYLLNVGVQFLALNAFIGHSYAFWGIDVLRSLLIGENWQDSPVFPRLTLCDVSIRRLGDTPRYTLQCHLRINTYNEKFYLFIW
ncbi:innexin unc-9 [Aphelenchoides avenae]|nr:innexin unc-9 [Aphelenchus avenae]